MYLQSSTSSVLKVGGTSGGLGFKGREVVFHSLEPLLGISSILFETRLGCLQEEIPEDILRFIAAVSDMLTLSETVVLFPLWSRGVLPFWKRFVQAWDDICDIGTQQQKQHKETVAALDSKCRK